MSETWLKDDKNLLNHVKIPGYKTECKNRDERRSGDVGMYIRDTIMYHLRKDIMRLDPDLERLWIKVKGRNKNHSYLVASIYQPKSDQTSKDAFIDQLETLLAQINNIWNGPIIIGGDTNIDTLKYSPQKGTILQYARAVWYSQRRG